MPTFMIDIIQIVFYGSLAITVILAIIVFFAVITYFLLVVADKILKLLAS